MKTQALVKLILLMNLTTALQLKEIKILYLSTRSLYRRGSYDFIQIIDLKPLKMHTNQLQNQINAFKFSCHPGRNFQLLFSILGNIQEKLANFENLTRTKRGLINFVGTIEKQLFGLIDDDDLQSINNHFNILSSNQKSITNELNLHNSILHGLNMRLNISLAKINENFKELSKFIDENRKGYKCAESKTDMLASLDMLLNLLNTLETAINLAQQNIIHNYFLPLREIPSILSKACQLYDDEAIVHFKKLHSYICLFHINIKTEDLTISLKLSVPIFLKELFHVYHIIPTPYQHQIVIPKTPYLVANLTNKQYLWINTQCPTIEDFSLCQGQIQIQEDPCYLPLLLGTTHHCKTTKILLQKSLIDQISKKDILVVPKNKILIKNSCQMAQNYLPEQPTLISMENCSLSIDGRKFYSQETLPRIRINLPDVETSHGDTRVIHLQDSNLQDVNHLDQLLKGLQPVQVRDFEENKITNYIFHIFLIIVFTFMLIYLYSKFRHKKNKNFIL